MILKRPNTGDKRFFIEFATVPRRVMDWGKCEEITIWLDYYYYEDMYDSKSFGGRWMSCGAIFRKNKRDGNFPTYPGFFTLFQLAALALPIGGIISFIMRLF